MYKLTSIKQEEDFFETDDEEDFIPPDFFDDLLIENVAKQYIEKNEFVDLQETQNQQENNKFNTLPKNNCDEIHDINSEINKKWRASVVKNEQHILDSENNCSKFSNSFEKEEGPNICSPCKISTYENFNGITENEQKFDSKTIDCKNLKPENTKETLNNLDNLEKELNKEEKSFVQQCNDDRNDSNKNTTTFYSAENNLSSLDENYISERLNHLRKEIRYLRFHISKNPAPNILTKLTYHMAACNNERILLEKYENQGKHMEHEEYKQCFLRADNSPSMIHSQLKNRTYTTAEKRLQINASKKPYTRKVNNSVKTPVQTYGTTKIYNQYVNYSTNYSSSQYYRADIRSSFDNEHLNCSNHMCCNGIAYLNTCAPFESLDYMTKESKLNRLSHLQNILRNCVNLPNEQFNSMLSEIIKIHIYLLRYEQEINAKFERERQFLQ